MNLVSPSETLFHAIESTIKAYRKFALQQISSRVEDITLDQSMVLIYLNEHDNISQNALAEMLFKDTASLTRILKTMIKNGFIERAINTEDLRRYKLKLTQKGKEVVEILPDIIKANRSTALSGVSKKDENQLKEVLQKIKENCQNQTT